MVVDGSMEEMQSTFFEPNPVACESCIAPMCSAVHYLTAEPLMQAVWQAWLIWDVHNIAGVLKYCMQNPAQGLKAVVTDSMVSYPVTRCTRHLCQFVQHC